MNEQFSVLTTGLPTFFQEMTHILIQSVENAETACLCI